MLLVARLLLLSALRQLLGGISHNVFLLHIQNRRLQQAAWSLGLQQNIMRCLLYSLVRDVTAASKCSTDSGKSWLPSPSKPFFSCDCGRAQLHCVASSELAHVLPFHSKFAEHHQSMHTSLQPMQFDCPHQMGSPMKTCVWSC